MDLYSAIFKRKSFHTFKGMGKDPLTEQDLKDIEEICQSLVPLFPDIKTKTRIIKDNKTTRAAGGEYAILFYSEKKENYLQNIGYMGEQLDLLLVEKNLATLWCGLAIPDEPTFEGLDYVILISVAKANDESDFRKDMFKAKRKEIKETWQGPQIEGVTEIARFAPSACNSQPWRITNENNKLTISRYKSPSRIGIMPQNMAPYFNRIDMGIYLLILETCLHHNNIPFQRTLFTDNGTDELTKVAEYTI